MSNAYLLSFKTTLSGKTIDDILNRACREAPRVAIADLDADVGQRARKRIRVAFSSAKDYQRFRDELRRLASIAPKLAEAEAA